MKESVALISQSISGCSILTNIYLIYVYFACPVTIANDFAFVFLAIGPLRYREVGQVLIVIFALSFFTSLLIVANSFIYRYIQVCRAHLFARYSSLHVVAIVLFINIAIITNYLAIVYVVFWPNPTTIEQLSGEVLSMTGFNSSECAQFGASLTVC
ncbi:hypothetical protein NECAME_15174 [Necator americanus]|uniref:7TM GPCR serpentine receptor class x (Srx) domain-containing protein n=1 Tax=Necator americanus TaxID=51031 RepID=W2SLQ3_NECAM|nr:hypothetical protein NECAME_15174 [Necator americanus]ETN69662.1 hypothetical protein NECAME_15174 [Necator americanus]